MTEPIRPEDVPDDIAQMAGDLFFAGMDMGSPFRKDLGILLAEVRERIVQRAEKCWADPFGNWNAEQAEAAKAVKQQMLRVIREWPGGAQ